MDIQITIITYITDYMLKDDTGTMEFIKKAVKDTENPPPDKLEKQRLFID